jgi:hypothetical protein
MAPHIIHLDPITVADRLEQLGVTQDALRESIYQAHLQRTRLTPNHPRIFPGLEMWGWSVASLREQLRPLGWFRIDVANFPLTVNETLGLAIAIASGDEGTGDPHAQASNRSKKGPNTVDAVETNQQFDMFAEFLPQTKEDAAGNDTWVLLHYTDSTKQEIRIELSRPSEIGDDGKISAWSERIILPSISFDGDPVEILTPSGPDIDIEIRRKA